jgi:hypothetical protein
MSKNHSREIITMRTQHKTPDDKKRAQAQAQRRIDANRRDELAARRNMFSHFRMWTVCPGKACMRARACRGDVERCLRERWHPLVPPRLKVLLQKTSALMANGMSPREAAAAAEADIARHDAAAAAQAPAPVPAAPASQPIKMPPRIRKSPPGPRVRLL